VPDTNIKKLQLLNGELDFIDQPDFKDIPELEANPNITVATSPGWSWNAIVFNMDLPDDHPLKKKEVRQAIAHAIDREVIANNVYFGNSVADDSPLPPGYLATDPGVHLYGTKANLDKARELLASAGVTEGFTVGGFVSVKPAMRRQMEIIASQLAELGITVNIEQLPGDVFERMSAREFDLGLMDITVMTPDPDSALYWFQHSGTVANYGYTSEVADQLLDQARIESEPAKREELYHQVLETILDDAPYIYTVHRGMVWAYNSALEGFVPRPQDYLLDFEPVHWT
jgi:peptide/nickel transport system substrate-binding protein